MRGLERDRRPSIRIGATIEQQITLARKDPTISVYGGPNRDSCRKAPTGQHGFFKGELELDRAAGFHCCGDGQRLDLDGCLAAKTSADIRDDHAYLGKRQTKDARQDFL